MADVNHTQGPRVIDKNGQCAQCGSTHYGSVRCPYRCERCGTNTEPCQQADRPRNSRWKAEESAALSKATGGAA